MNFTRHALWLLCLLSMPLAAREQPKVLVFTKTRGYSHASVPDGVKAVYQMGNRLGFSVDTTSDVRFFKQENLKNYAALVFISTTGAVLEPVQRTELIRYLEAGGGFAGVHGASTGGKAWPWYVQMLGASFSNHPEPCEGLLIREDDTHAVSRHYPSRMYWKDEWYNFTDVQPGSHVLLSVDEASYNGGEHGRRHPVAWTREFGGGRVFYTALGHFSHHFTDALFVRHLEEGIKYAMGEPDYSKVKTPVLESNP